MNDDDYRRKMTALGADKEILTDFKGHELDCVGNIFQLYRTSQRRQDPAAYQIRNRTMERARSRARRNQVDPPMHEQVKVAVFIAVGIIIAALALLSMIGEVVVGMS